ncbi:MAG: hypothetical protein OJF50_002797 [Nitrospira sp.]|nr:hypothetical protein [Nitrospira sp.]
MLQTLSVGVLGGHCCPTLSAAFTGVPCRIQHGVNLALVRSRELVTRDPAKP